MTLEIRLSEDRKYEAPKIVKLGTLQEVTLGGSKPNYDDGYGDPACSLSEIRSGKCKPR